GNSFDFAVLQSIIPHADLLLAGSLRRLDEIGSEQVPAAIESRHHGAHRAADDRRDLSVRETLDVAELDDLPEQRGQATDRLPHLLDRLATEKDVLGGERNGAQWTLHRHHRLPFLLAPQRFVRGVRPPSPLPIDLGVPHDREDPGLEALRPVERVEGFVGTDQTLLEEVLGILASEHERVVVQGIEVLIDQILELGSIVHSSPGARPATTHYYYVRAASLFPVSDVS